MTMAPAPQPAGWRLSALLSGIATEMLDASRPIERITLSSGDAGPGALFLSVNGHRARALADVQLAAAQGCTAIAVDADGHWDLNETSHLSKSLSLPVVSISALRHRVGEIAARFYGDPSASLNVIDIAAASDGGLGHMLAQALADERCGLINAEGIGFPTEHFERDLPRIDAISLQHSLAVLRAAGAHQVALDVRSQTPAQAGLNAVHTGTVVFGSGPATSLAATSRGASVSDAEPAATTEAIGHSAVRDQGSDHPSVSASQLMEHSSLRWAVLNLDSAANRSIERRLPPEVAQAAYSLEPNVRFDGHAVWARTRRIIPRARGLRIDLETSAGAGTIELPILGESNASNLLATVCVLLLRGRDLQTSLRGLGRIRPAPGRIEWFGGERSPLVVVDAAHTARALQQIIAQLRAHRRGRLVSVFGCPGGGDRDQRAVMGRVAEQLSDQVILTDDNPGGEDGDRIIEQILSGLDRPDAVIVERQRGLAIRRAIALAGNRDTVLISGKGQATRQDMGELKVHFSDRAQVVQALNEW